MDFRRMDTWSMRNAEVSTTVNVPGNIQSYLRVNTLGHVVGWVRNATRLMLEHPVILAGRSWISLPPMAPGESARVDIAPRLNTFKLRAESVWQMILGTPSWNFGNAYPIPLGCFTCKVYLPASGPSGFSALPFQPANTSYPRERNFRARMRNVANMLPEAQTVTSLGEVLFIAWNQQPLLDVTVNGSAAPTRNLNLIVQPLVPQSVTPGHFLLRTGTVGAQLLSVDPAPNRNQYDPYPSGLDIGAGGSATFEFQLPSADRIRFARLTLNVNAGGANSIDMGRVWDWRSRSWVVFDLSQGYAGLTQPNRFVSPSGTVLVKLVNTDTTHDLQIYDSHASLQLSGAGYAR